jgi:demethylmenaquinone methyltransferase/2-methoxy-6-polyprenyl-1,4-benzoquinol methylase
MDRRWKRRLADLVPAGGQSILDLACGTGDIAYEFASRRARQVVGLDITLGMLSLAARKTRRARGAVVFVAGDMTAVPFGDATFDVVTTGYGLRNVPRLETALSEAARVLRPGGVLLSLDFNKPENPIVRRVYLSYLTVVGSTLGMILHGDPDTYRYIPESIKRYPGSQGVTRLVGASGFARVDTYPLLGGLLTIHRAVK